MKNIVDKTVIGSLSIIILLTMGCATTSTMLDREEDIFIPNTKSENQEKCYSCYDFNPCTLDKCDAENNFQCEYIKLDGNQIGCSGRGNCEVQTCRNGGCEVIETIQNCCGNFKCEEGENYGNCQSDCALTKKDCREFEEEGTRFTFATYHSDCKDHQILVCRNLEVRNCDEFWRNKSFDKWDCRDENQYDWEVYSSTRAICLLNMANNYNDPEICEHIFQVEDYDTYWYCKAKFVDGRSACSNIDSNYWLEQCLEDT